MGGMESKRDKKVLAFIKRLLTFNSWPQRFNFVKPLDLARAGFIYTGYSDVVRCKFCKIELGQWRRGDCPMTDHLRWSPSCPFIARKLKRDDDDDDNYDNNEGVDVAGNGPTTSVQQQQQRITCDCSSQLSHINNNNNTDDDDDYDDDDDDDEDDDDKGNKYKCRICLEKDVQVAFISCGHTLCCKSCAAKLNNCCICLKRINGTMRIYLS